MAKKRTGAADAENELLGKKVNLSAKFDAHGLTIGGMSRALAAADMLVGALIGWPAGAMERVRRRAALKGEAQEEHLKEILARDRQLRLTAATTAPALPAPDEFIDQVAARIDRDDCLRQMNREAVWTATEDVLAQGGSVHAKDGSDDGAAISPDWLFTFASYAERATSDEMRAAWAKVLAGEIRTPGGFGVSALRIVSELDPESARLFESLVRESVNSGAYVVKDESISGSHMEKLTELEELGLLQGVSGTISMSLRRSEDDLFYYGEHPFTLRVTPRSPSAKPSFPVFKISRAGQQIARLFERDIVAALRRVAPHIVQAKRVELLNAPITNGTVAIVGSEVLVENT